MNEVIRIGNRQVGEGHPVFIVGEIGINHDGKKDKAKALIDAAVECKLDAVKVQSFRVDEFLSPEQGKVFEYISGGKKITENSYDMFKMRELKWEWHKELFDYARQRGLLFFSTPQSEEGADFLFELGIPAFKIGSDDLTHYKLIRHVAAKRLPLLLSTGMSTLEEIDKAVETVKSAGNNDLILLHCISLYPAPPKDINLKAIEVLRERYDVPVGYSDHSESIAISAAAVALGTCVIERHFTLDKNSNGPDHLFSADPEEMRMLVESIRTVEAALGRKVKMPAESEEKTRLNARRSIVAAADIRIDEVITPEKIAFKRPGTGLSPESVDAVLGARAKGNIKKGELIKPELIKK